MNLSNDKITEIFSLLLKGKKPSPIKIEDNLPDNEIKQVYEYINRFIKEYNDSTDFIFRISNFLVFLERNNFNMHKIKTMKIIINNSIIVIKITIFKKGKMFINFSSIILRLFPSKHQY